MTDPPRASHQVGAWGIPLRSHVTGQARLNQHLSAPVNGVSVAAAKVESYGDAHAIEEDSDSDEDEGDKGADVETLQASIFGEYAGVDTSDDAGVAKIRGLLVASRSGGTSCLICLERVKGTDFVWDCKSGCFAIFHITCIQSWASQSLNAAEQRALSRLSEENFPGAAAAAALHWYCPKCRAEYSRSHVPKEYRCFCERELNPVPDPWLAPHTCGERCGRELAGYCGHECQLLCHPGPCPPCPRLVQVSCFCETKSEVRRCGRRSFSCGGICQKSLACQKHVCDSVCHGEDCPPCTKAGMYPCRCKREVALRECKDSDFQCERPCGRELNCKKHGCDKGCHSGPCGDCKLAGRRTCPCGKMEYNGVACDKAVATCGSTCEKILGCTFHRCQERCHFGPCNSTCRVMLTKACHCGSLKKQVPCHQDLQCERKCQRLRDCTRHACRKRCCDRNCPPCSEVCGRKLRCGNHKCPSPCHRGECAPCPVSVRISCACGETSFEVPCGMERDQKPPRCSKRCQILQRCSHGTDCKRHACHYGACPSCQLVCNLVMSCGHRCPRRCHGPRPIPNSEYTLKPKKKKKKADDTSLLMGVPCPPCLEPVVKQCLGQHYGIERTMVCSAIREFQCGNLCGRLLACGNHFCSQPCHPIQKLDLSWNMKGQNFSSGGPTISLEESSSNGGHSFDSCDQCHLQCQKERALCSHPCPSACHAGDCLPCKALVKRRCYCETLVHVFDCDIFSSASESDQAKMLSCGGPCHRKLPNCAHMCSDTCHLGVCQMANVCRKMVVVRCPCQRLKKEWPCAEVQAAQLAGRQDRKEGSRGGLFVGLISCDQECLSLALAKQAQIEAEQLRQRKGKELQLNAPAPTTSRRRKIRNQDTQLKITRWQEIRPFLKTWSIRVGIVFFLFLVIYCGSIGLAELNDWMNRRDAAYAKMRKRPPFHS